eukprot:CAMPEP_0172451032 /NCGR_PEP_ID=MMETSP1065-20121228/9200_1 /TAXON_ID=265537 /ORGANISM="Amphiprora paludosa, Strain CCMP125" /LENGTH=334 /DNA_ID=CAMNT_0013202919 /DNA_START=432 /DNA_END=1436 /DNA_ORIENTATION=-
MAGSLGVWLIEKIADDAGDFEFLKQYFLSILMGYMYLRLSIHVITHHFLLQASSVFKGMPTGLQQDCAFMAVDGPSLFLWSQLVGYALVVIFLEGSKDRVIGKIGPFISTGSALYAADRFIHIFNCFRLDRFIHHSLVCLWMVVVVEWVPPKFIDFGYLILAFTMEVLEAKVRYFWFLIVRFTRRGWKKTQPVIECEDENYSLPPDEHQGHGTSLDQILIPSSPHRMALYSKIFFTYAVFTAAILPLGLISAYLFRYRHEIQLFWMIATPAMLMVFNIIDFPLWKEAAANCKVSKWSTLKEKTVSASMDITESPPKSSSLHKVPSHELPAIEHV